MAKLYSRLREMLLGAVLEEPPAQAIEGGEVEAMAVDPQALRNAVEDLITALSAEGDALIVKQKADADLGVASAALDAAKASSDAAHAEVVAKAHAIQALVDEADGDNPTP